MYRISQESLRFLKTEKIFMMFSDFKTEEVLFFFREFSADLLRELRGKKSPSVLGSGDDDKKSYLIGSFRFCPLFTFEGRISAMQPRPVN